MRPFEVIHHADPQKEGHGAAKDESGDDVRAVVAVLGHAVEPCEKGSTQGPQTQNWLGQPAAFSLYGARDVHGDIDGRVHTQRGLFGREGASSPLHHPLVASADVAVGDELVVEAALGARVVWLAHAEEVGRQVARDDLAGIDEDVRGEQAKSKNTDEPDDPAYEGIEVAALSCHNGLLLKQQSLARVLHDVHGHLPNEDHTSGNGCHHAVEDEGGDEAAVLHAGVRLHQVGVVAEEALDVDAKRIRALKVVGQQHRPCHDDQLHKDEAGDDGVTALGVVRCHGAACSFNRAMNEYSSENVKPSKKSREAAGWMGACVRATPSSRFVRFFTFSVAQCSVLDLRSTIRGYREC